MSSEGFLSEAPQPSAEQAEGAEVETSRWPQPIPEEWKQGRAARADEWFQEQKEELHSRYLTGKQAVQDNAACAAELAATTAAYDARVQGMVREQQAFSRSVQQQLSVLRDQRLQANLEYQALRLPHFTPPRPLALLTAPNGGDLLVERLFTRALATTLMTAVAAAEGPSGGGGGGAGGEVVWCEMGQSRLSMQDPPLARAEALERCRLAIVVLSPALLASPQWAVEKRILTARLTAPPGTWVGAPLSAVLIVRLHVPPPKSVGAAAAAAVAGQGRKAAAAVAAATAAAAAPDANPPPPLTLPDPVPGYPVQSYPVTVMNLTVPLPQEPPLEGSAAGTAMAQSVRDAVAAVLSAASLSGGLHAAGLRLVPDPPPIHLHPAHIHHAPDQLLAASYGGSATAAADALSASLTMGASLAGAGSSSSLATQLLASPARAAVAAGPAATAAHLLPSSYMQRAVEDWSVYDTTMWLASLGRSLERWTPSFVALAVDGPLLAVADGADLRDVCGVASDKAVEVLRGALQSALRRLPLLPPARALLPRPDAPASPLPPEAAVLPPQQRAALLADMVAYYDRDHSGDLNLGELDQLVRACGLRLNDVRLKDVLDDYDYDADGRLNPREAERLLDDVWRLVMAQQDVAAWTPSEAIAALTDAVDLTRSFETPRATPNADKTAAAMAGHPASSRLSGTAGTTFNRGLPSRGGLSDAGSDAPSINILGGAISRGASPRAASPAVNTAPSTAVGRATSRSTSGTRRPLSTVPPTVEGEDETGARVRLVDRTYSMVARRGSGGEMRDGTSTTTGGGGGEHDDEDDAASEVSYRSYGWGLPPRLPLKATMSLVTRRHSEAASMDSDKAPWAGAITPRTARSGGKNSLSPEEMAARDIDVQQLLRRDRTETEIQESLRSMLDCLDLRRQGRVELQMLRASLASAGPPNQLSPLHTQLLSDLAETLVQLPTGTTASLSNFSAGATNGTTGTRRLLLASGPLAEVLLGLEVLVQSYVTAAVKAVASAQMALMTIVYGDRGISAMLRQLYRQTTGPDDPLELLTRGPRIHAGASEAALEALMEVQGIKPTALLRAALLPCHQVEPEGLEGGAERDDPLEAAAILAAQGPAGASAALLLSCGPTPLSLHSARRYPQSWASATAHMVHVYNVLLRQSST